MLQFFRSNAKGVLGKTIVTAIVLVFTLWGAQSIVAISTSNDAPVSVNGVDISEYEVSKLTDIQKRNIQAQLGDAYDPSLISDAMIRQSVLQNLVSQELEWQAALDLGMAMSDEIVTEIIVNTKSFQTDGLFDQDTYTRVLGQYGYAPIEYKEMVRQDLINFQLKRGLLASGFILDHEVDRVSALESQTRDFGVLVISPEQFIGQVSVEADDIEAYYQENKGQFRTDELLSVDYVVLSKDKIAESLVVSDQDIEDAYENYVTQQSGNVDKSIAHILITSESRSDSEAKSLANSIKQRVDAGESFATLAEEFSDDPGSAASGGELGIYFPGMFVEEFEQAVNSLQSEGDLTGPVKTDFGYHLILLTDISETQVASFESQESRLRNIVLDRKVSDELLVLKEELTNLAFSESGLVGVAEQFELVIETSELFGRSGGAGLFADSSVVSAAFDPSVVEEDENSNVVTLADGSLIIMHMNDYQSSGYKPVAEVSDLISNVLTREASAQEAIKVADRLMVDLAEAGSITAVEVDREWSNYQQVARSGADVPQEILFEVFKMAKPVESNYSLSKVSLTDGSVAIIALNLVAENEPQFTEEDRLGIENYMSSLISEAEYEQWFNGVEENSKVKYR